jgi:hypothetical protein
MQSPEPWPPANAPKVNAQFTAAHDVKSTTKPPVGLGPSSKVQVEQLAKQRQKALAKITLRPPVGAVCQNEIKAKQLERDIKAMEKNMNAQTGKAQKSFERYR